RAAGGTIAGDGASAVGHGDRVDEGQTKAMALGMDALDEALKNLRLAIRRSAVGGVVRSQQLGGKAGAGVFDEDAGEGAGYSGGDRDVGFRAGVAQLILHEVRQHAGAEGDIDLGEDGSGD